MATSKSTRYTLYGFPSPSAKEDALASSSALDAIANAFVTSQMKVMGKSNELIPASPGHVVFDSETGKFNVCSKDKNLWGRPSYKCPDCDGYLVLRKKYFKIGPANSPWVYICENKDKGCKAIVPAKVDGSILSIPADAETRKARQLTNQALDDFANKASDIMEWSGDPDDLPKIIQKSKARAYRFLANRMQAAGASETQIAKMDIPTLRIAYSICKTSNPADLLKFGKLV